MDLNLGTGSDSGSQRTPSSDRTDGPLEIEGLERALAEARESIQTLEAKLADQGRARADLVHLVSHELRTPITVISGFGRLLQNESQGPLGREQHRFVEECLKACRRLDHFVGDLLEACPDTGSPLSVEPSEGDLDATIRSLLESLAPVLEERSQTVETNLGVVSPFRFDGRRIEQVVTNLMTNAVRYGREGGLIRVRTAQRNDPGNESAVWIEVEDDGPGIAEGDRERLFQPYVRGERVTDEGGSRDGLGIGLAICRRIIEAHSGTIHVETGDLGGARFVVRLPVAACVPEDC